MHASRENPHPYQYENTFGFVDSCPSRKTITIASEQLTSNGRSCVLYVSVTADTETANYTLMGTSCRKSECSEGTMPADQTSTGPCSVDVTETTTTSAIRGPLLSTDSTTTQSPTRLNTSMPVNQAAAQSLLSSLPYLW